MLAFNGGVNVAKAIVLFSVYQCMFLFTVIWILWNKNTGHTAPGQCGVQKIRGLAVLVGTAG